jgi:hypothetical protein
LPVREVLLGFPQSFAWTTPAYKPNFHVTNIRRKETLLDKCVHRGISYLPVLRRLPLPHPVILFLERSAVGSNFSTNWSVTPVTTVIISFARTFSWKGNLTRGYSAIPDEPSPTPPRGGQTFDRVLTVRQFPLEKAFASKRCLN